MKLGTINVRGLNDVKKQQKFILYCKMQNFDVIFVQETHIDTVAKAKIFQQKWGGKILWSFGTNTSCGVAIMFKPHLRLDVLTSASDNEGRVLSVGVEIKGSMYNFISVYAPCKWMERVPFMRGLAQYIDRSSLVVMAGDFNCIKDPAIDYRGPAVSFTVPTQGSEILNDICTNFVLRDVYRTRFPNRPNYTCISRQSFSRLDHVYMASSLYGSVSSISLSPVGFSDHSCVIVCLSDSQDEKGPGYWKCNVSTLSDPDLSADIRHHAALAAAAPVKDGAWWERLKETFRRTIRLHSVRLAAIRKHKMRSLESQINRMTEEPGADSARLTALKAELDECLNYIVKGEAVRAHMEILQEELPSSFLKREERSNGARKRMDRLNTEYGLVTDNPSILKEAAKFYSALYTAEPVDDSLIEYFLSDATRLPEDEGARCDGDISFDECMTAIGGMKGGKAPGADGLPSEFYRLFFPFFGHGFVEMINICCEQGVLPKSLRHGVITLLCKDEATSENLNSWRPISLLNIDYKIVSKTLANRLKTVVNLIVHPDQTCAIPGRSIADNLHLMRNIVDYARSGSTPVAVLALDQAKAFDRVSHKFLFATLQAYGFGDSFINWIRICYSQCTSQVIVNGFLSESIDITRSIRQGCGLSALLYVLCIEPFAHKVRIDRSIVGLALPGAPDEVRLSQYADDVTAIVCTEGSIERLFYLADLYGGASGALLNKHKCQGMLLGSLAGSKTFYPSFGWSTKPIKICGVLFGVNDTAEENWTRLVTKLQESSILNITQSLTFAGKAMFINQYIYSQIWYIAQIYHVTRRFTKDLNKIINRFLWGKTPPLLARKYLVCEHGKGGVGLMDVETRSDAYAVKHIGDVITIANRAADDPPPPRWFHLARYWAGRRLKRHDPSLASHCYSHAEDPCPYYSQALEAWARYCKSGVPLPHAGKVSAIYRQLIPSVREVRYMPPNASLEGWENLCSDIVSPRARDVSWRLAHDILPNASKLYRFRAATSPRCAFCTQPETARHLFVKCSVASGLWRRLDRLVGRAFGPNCLMNDVDVLQSRTPAALRSAGQRSLYMALTTELKEIIWKSRCRVVKENFNCKEETIWKIFVCRVRERCRLDFSRLTRARFVDVWCCAGAALCRVVDDELTVEC